MFIKRLSTRMFAPFQLLYWRVAMPEAEGAKVLIEYAGKYLLIREIYGAKHWTLPGGRSRKGEEATETAKRKVHDEVGINLSNPKSLGSYFHTRQHKRDVVCAYYAHVDSPEFQINPNTIGEARWFSREELASLTQSPSVADVFELYENSLRGQK
jgi:8-oxo-dGTP diphosphatase